MVDGPRGTKSEKGQEQGVGTSVLRTGDQRRRLCELNGRDDEESLHCLLGAIETKADTTSNLTLSFQFAVSPGTWADRWIRNSDSRSDSDAAQVKAPSESSPRWRQVTFRTDIITAPPTSGIGKEDTLCLFRGIRSTLLPDRTLTATQKLHLNQCLSNESCHDS